MIEVSVVLLTLISEALFISLVVIAVWTVVTMKRKKRDRQAVEKLIEQVRHQSQTRLETTGSFLSEKYRFEGDELKKGVKAIDKAEKKFIQHLIQVYLNRDADAIPGMDASIAEMVDAYKSLTPALPDAQESDNASASELEELRKANEKLQEELAITKETMGNMISEFGNMFGGGHDHELEKHEVVEKVSERTGKGETTDEVAIAQAEEPEELEIAIEEQPDDIEIEDQAESVDDDAVSLEEASESEKIKEADILADEGVDELLDSIDLSDGK